MHLRIVHTTGFEYDGVVAASLNEARLTPQSTAGQLVAHTRLDVTPTPWTSTYRDYWGTQVTSFEVLEPHQTLTVVSTCVVHTTPVPPTDERVSWAELADHQDQFVEFLVLTDRVRSPEDLGARIDTIRAESPTPTDAARALCDLVHDEVEYLSGSTDVQTLASTAWEQRAGVCQDLAHLVIGGLRRMDIPARYVSGYLHPGPDEIGLTVAGESHAWVEWWDGSWRGFDPTNDQEPGERHVVIARGREYDDVQPLSGIFNGTGSTSRMSVEVAITRLP